MTKPVKILIADDHRMFNDAICELLRPVYAIVQQVYDGIQLLYAIALEKPDLIILDINLPRLNGLDAAKKIRKDYPEIKILIVSMYNQGRMVKLANEIALEGYILKDSSSQILLSGIENILNGQRYFDAVISKKKEIKDTFVDKWMITLREKQIITELITGKKAEDIAQELGLAYETVKTHRKNIYYKLEINSLAELIRFVNEHGI